MLLNYARFCSLVGIDSQYFNVFEKPADVCVVDLDANFLSL